MGALNKDILVIFMSEASIIGIIGATLGLVHGIGAGYLLTGVFRFGPAAGPANQNISPVYLPSD